VRKSTRLYFINIMFDNLSRCKIFPSDTGIMLIKRVASS
jgi:hypothetical protein